MYEYEAKVLRIVDGDTFDLDVDLGMKIHRHERVRLATVDVFETWGVSRDSEEYKQGKAAVALVESLMPVGSNVKIKTYKMKSGDERKGARGRYLADVFFQQEGMEGSWINISSVLKTNGFVKKEYPL